MKKRQAQGCSTKKHNIILPHVAEIVPEGFGVRDLLTVPKRPARKLMTKIVLQSATTAVVIVVDVGKRATYPMPSDARLDTFDQRFANFSATLSLAWSSVIKITAFWVK